ALAMSSCRLRNWLGAVVMSCTDACGGVRSCMKDQVGGRERGIHDAHPRDRASTSLGVGGCLTLNFLMGGFSLRGCGTAFRHLRRPRLHPTKRAPSTLARSKSLEGPGGRRRGLQ